ncbi:LysE family translocator [Undibacterium curvum]|uniref:LysE family translocator n=1 Tax=Undibacterium curvum TaxID=2762294 RepID=A0ABR7A8T8_9BURK|nr:LysE family translocator [Undibacterium curvum]MBC3933302.1 LysE family translocator [Undibacterium curvum]
MPLTEFFAFSVFAWIGSFTPGPNVAIAATTGVNHGFRAALPQVAGVPLGFVIMMWVVGSSGTLVLQQYPVLILMMKLLGNAYLLYLAWKLCFSTNLADNRGMQALTLPQAALFQVVNPKAWMMLVAATSTYVIGQSDFLNRMTWMSIGFAVPSALSLLAWAWMGQQLRAWLLVGQRLRYFNLMMGASLACTALWMMR